MQRFVLWFSDWKSKILSFNRNIKLFIVANTLIQIGMGVFMVMYNLYIKELGMPETVNGRVISMTALASAIMLIPAGFLSDKIGRKWMIIVGALLTASTLFYRSFAVMESPLITAAFFTGLFMAFVQVSGVPLLAENSKPSERVHLFSIYFALMTVANVVGSLLGGIISDLFQLFGGLSPVEAIRWSLVIGAALFTLGLLPLFRLRDHKQRQEERTSTEDATSDKKDAAPDSRLSKNLIVIFHFSFASLLIGFGSGLVVPYLNLYFANRFDATNTYIGLVLSLGSAMTAVAMLIGPILVRRVGKVKALILFQVLSIPFLILTAYTTSLLLASLGFLLRQALMNAGNPIQSAIAMEVVHDKYKGLANSVNQMVFNVGWAAMGPIAAGLVITFGSYWGYAYAFSITAGLYIISSVYYYFIFGKRKLAEE
ncbi:MFS transporter [Planomicrobium sp. YIM 101495]|uniref:MFS transporter n=1 Tax=Planomicrobium sp. YIM 101495 TaxID=2665160 RepID=UPI0012B994D1|nr:MFS transporter [Planomicrobium sp. YIM 101495]MTD31400.1 MFS transporter [Planomicrobium sp. YIM 101495]